MKWVAAKDDQIEAGMSLPTIMALGLEELIFSPFV